MHCFKEYMEVYGDQAGNPLFNKDLKWHSVKVLAGDTCEDFEFDDETQKVIDDAYGN